MFRVLRETYPKAASERRKNVIEAVLAFCWPNEEDEDKERYTARRHFDWLHWIHEAAPDCVMARQALDDVLKRYPDFQPSEHPDLTHSTTSTEPLVSQIPWTVEEILARPIDECWIQRKEFLGPDWDGFVRAVADAASLNFEWGLDLGLRKELKEFIEGLQDVESAQEALTQLVHGTPFSGRSTTMPSRVSRAMVLSCVLAVVTTNRLSGKPVAARCPENAAL